MANIVSVYSLFRVVTVFQVVAVLKPRIIYITQSKQCLVQSPNYV
jgi:hypothetical protein